MQRHTEKFIKQRRFYMVLPLLVTPFIVTIFWALGGGQVAPAQATELHTGLDLTLPDAHFSKGDEKRNKMNYYDDADRDSVKYRSAVGSDPFYVLDPLTDATTGEVFQSSKKTTYSQMNASVREGNEPEPIEDRVNAKLGQLYKQLNTPTESATEISSTMVAPASDQALAQDVDRLEQMMEMMNQGKESDPEMDQIQGVLDKILDIQHPDRAAEKIRLESMEHRDVAYPVATTDQTADISLFGSNSIDATRDTTKDTQSQTITNGFLGLDGEKEQMPYEENAIRAVIHDTQELMAGSTVQIRLQQDIFISGIRIPKGELIYGTCSINGERFNVAVTSIQFDNSIYPISLKAYDRDGMEGIRIAGTITQDAARQGANQAIQDLQLLSGADDSFGAQMATAGVQAAKGLFTKKSRQVKGLVKAGYQIFLKDSNYKK